jgi:hypothetical protein
MLPKNGGKIVKMTQSCWADCVLSPPQAFLELIEAFEWKSFTILYEESSGRKINLLSNSFMTG